MQLQEVTLKQSIIEALQHPEDTSKAKKAHATFLRETLILPVHRQEENQSEPIPLFIENDNAYFLPVFSEKSYCDEWAGESLKEIDFLHLTGNELIKGTGENVYICLDIGQDHYKQFSPEEVARLKLVVSKLDTLIKRNKQSAT